MPEISERQLSKESGSKVRSSRKVETKVNDVGIYTTRDNAEYILRLAVPTLAETLDAPDKSLRGLIGKVGSINRDATIFSDKDWTRYKVFIERQVEPNDYGQTIGRITLEVIIRQGHILDESELVTEWPVIEQSGAADELLGIAAGYHSQSFRDDSDIDLDDPLLNAEMMQGQSNYLEQLNEEDTEPMASAVLGGDVTRFFEKKLRLSTGIRPSLKVDVGYEIETTSFSLEIGDNYGLEIIGDTPAELSIMAQLGKETFVVVDSETMEEFISALEIVGVLKRKRKRLKKDYQ